MAEPLDLLRIPEGLRSSGDPVVGNPFRDHDPRYIVWADATRCAEQELRAFNAAGMGTLHEVQPRTPDEARRVLVAHQGQLVTSKFDIWAKRGVHVVWSEPDEQSFGKWLEHYANAWLNEIKQFFPAEVGDTGWLLEKLRPLLIARIEYWKSEARRYLNQQMEDGRAHGLSSERAWKLIEQDYTLRLSLVTTDWAEVYLKAKNTLISKARESGNSAYLAPAWAEMQIAEADMRAEWAFKTCCEIWDIQGRKKGRLFFRVVFDWCLQPMFSMREGCFRHELELHETRTRSAVPQGHSTILGHMKQQMDKLRAKWNTKLEIETRNVETRERLAQTQQAESPPPTAPPITPSQQQPRTAEANTSPSSRPLLTKYRSAIKRAILIQLTKNPSASDLEICRGLDADGAEEMPTSWRNGSLSERLFVDAYRDNSRRRRVEITISKVRADLRQHRLIG